MLYKDVYVCLIASSMNDVLFSPSCRMIVAFTWLFRKYEINLLDVWSIDGLKIVLH